MKNRIFFSGFLAVLAIFSIAARAQQADLPTAIDARPFPRAFTAQATEFSIHQPQFETWEGNELKGRFAMSVKTGVHTGADGKTQDALDYGVVWFKARTEVDKSAREVVLTGITFDRASFPTAADKQTHYLDLARSVISNGKALTVDLDQVEAAISIAAVEEKIAAHPVRNDPPDIIFATGTAVLILIDGEPVLKPAGTTGVRRVINTRSLLLESGGRYYTCLADVWASAAALGGPWTRVTSVSSALTGAMQQAVGAKLVDTLDQPPDALKNTLAAGKLPEIDVRTHPSELIAVEGDPEFIAIDGTTLSYIANTGADVFVDSSQANAWYVLISGRWFTAAGSHGPWTFVDSTKLPVSFAKIPPDSAKGAVLASIAGTPQAREAIIANSIPQTATVNIKEAKLEVKYDGAPQFKPIDGTALQYAWNTPVPVIRISATSFYAVDKGIWFEATAAKGPWKVATSVPAAIYGIPTSSPLHYVTYVRIYGVNGDEEYVGYTPGYYGTVVTNTVVVYGSGAACSPWVGAYWYGCPATYGFGVYFGWNAWVGWTFGFGWGGYGPWIGPWYGPWWGPWYGPVSPWGWWGGGAAAWNVYGHWGNSVVRGTAAAWADPWTGNYGRGYRGSYYNQRTGGSGVGRAGINTNVYTGTTTAGAQGMRYNPQTGRVVAGGGAVAVNPYTGQAAAAGNRTVVNTNTGRVTNEAGAAGMGPNGAAGAGAFNSDGRYVDAKGAAGFHYNADTGQMDHGGVVDINDNIYAGKDGHVYHYDDGQWNSVTRPDRSNNISGQTRDLDMDRNARGNAARFGQGGGGGFRPGLGARPAMRGGFRR